MENTTTPLWTDQPQLLADLAAGDLEAGIDIRPTLIAFVADEPLFLATLRPFAKGGHHDPIMEVAALALGLGATRIALSLAGRAWSTRDPVPPVVEGVGDLRERVLVVHAADGEADPVACRSIVHRLDGDRLGAVACDTDEEVLGWVVELLRRVVADPMPDGADALQQATRCDALGHDMAWAEEGLRRLVAHEPVPQPEEP